MTTFIGMFVNSSASSAQAIAAGSIFMIIVQVPISEMLFCLCNLN
jgi:hypothetical protein